jgi:Ca-activated chloride channel family protein
MLSFENPFALFFLIFIPMAISLRKYGVFRGGRLTLSLGIWQGPQHPAAPGIIKFLKKLGQFFYGLSFVLLIVALANPGVATREEVAHSLGTTLMFVLDESPTMAAQDYSPKSRFDSSREVIERFVRNTRGAQFGLISFAQSAALRVIPTPDVTTFLEKMWKLNLADLGFGTAIGLGLALGGLYLSEVGGNRVLILLTDGQNNAGEIRPETAARALNNLGIKVYIIGVGSQDRVPAILRDPRTGEIVAGTLEESYNEEELRRLAQLSGGSFFTAQSPGILELVLRSIESREISQVRTSTRVKFLSFQREVSLLAVGFLVLYLILRTLVLREVL